MIAADRKARLRRSLGVIRKRVSDALRDQRRVAYLALGNPVLTVATAAAAYLAGKPDISLTAGAVGGIKDGTILLGIRKQLEKYFSEKRHLRDRLARIEAWIVLFDENDEDEYESIKTEILGFLEE